MKKALSIILIIALCATGIYFGYPYIEGFFHKETITDEEIPQGPSQTKVVLNQPYKPGWKYMDQYKLDAFYPLADMDDIPYVWFHCSGPSTVQYESMSKEAFEKRWKGIALQPDFTDMRPSYDAAQLTRLTKAVFMTLTKSGNEVKYKTGNGTKEIDVIYNIPTEGGTHAELQCFNGEGPEDKDTGSKFSFDHKIKLDFDNIEVKTLIGSEEGFEFNSFNVIVTADVTTKKNDGTFKDISWIPKEGETENVTFALLLDEENRFGIAWATVQDIAVIP